MLIYHDAGSLPVFLRHSSSLLVTNLKLSTNTVVSPMMPYAAETDTRIVVLEGSANPVPFTEPDKLYKNRSQISDLYFITPLPHLCDLSTQHLPLTL